MIAYQIPEYKKWIEYLATNPSKIQGCLEKIDSNDNLIGRCCLGHYCFINNLARIIGKEDCLGFIGKVRYGYDQQAVYLPHKEAKKLNITVEGRFTAEGIKLVKNIIGNQAIDNSVCSLSHVNDRTSLSSKQIGELIEQLAEIERTKNIECFKPYS